MLKDYITVKPTSQTLKATVGIQSGRTPAPKSPKECVCLRVVKQKNKVKELARES